MGWTTVGFDQKQLRVFFAIRPCRLGSHHQRPVWQRNYVPMVHYADTMSYATSLLLRSFARSSIRPRTLAHRRILQHGSATSSCRRKPGTCRSFLTRKSKFTKVSCGITCCCRNMNFTSPDLPQGRHNQEAVLGIFFRQPQLLQRLTAFNP